MSAAQVTEMTMPETTEDVFSHENIADPYSLFERVRELGSVVWSTRLEAWLVLGFDEVGEIREGRACICVEVDK